MELKYNSMESVQQGEPNQVWETQLRNLEEKVYLVPH